MHDNQTTFAYTKSKINNRIKEKRNKFMKYIDRLQKINKKELINNFEEILIDEEFIDDEGEITECFFCGEKNITFIKTEYAKLDNNLKTFVKKIIRDVKYHEILKIEYCDECGEILRIIREDKTKLYNIFL